jgi:hypothetical protein
LARTRQTENLSCRPIDYWTAGHAVPQWRGEISGELDAISGRVNRSWKLSRSNRC